VHFELLWNILAHKWKLCVVCLVLCLDMTYFSQWQTFMEIMIPWFPRLLTSIIKNLLLVLKRKQVLIQILTHGVHTMSKSLIWLCHCWKGGNGSLLLFLFQTTTIGLSCFIWNQYLELKPDKPESLWQFQWHMVLGKVSQQQGKPSKILWWVEPG